MIRKITPEDSEAVISLAVASGLFPADETEILDDMLTDYFGGKTDEGHVCVIDEEEARIRDFYDAGDDVVVFRKALVAG